MKTAKMLLWDEIDHDREFPWPTTKALPQEYITPQVTLASIRELPILPLHLRKISQ
jgi:hypothetical protein